MRASSPLLALVLWLLSTTAVAAPPVVIGDDEVVRLVRERWPRVEAAEAPEVIAYGILRDEGWLWARVARVPGDDRRLRVDVGPRARLGTLTVRGADPALAALWRDAAGLVEGVELRPIAFERVMRRGLRALGERGHPFASATVIDQEADDVTGRVDLTVTLVPGDRLRVGAVTVEGARHTRPEVLARLSGLEAGELVRESTLEDARARLEARPTLVEDVQSIGLRRRVGDDDEVDVVVRLRQPAATGSFAAAIGAVRTEDDETRISGSVDLVLLDLFGTARAFEGRWSDDGSTRRRLDLAYLEPMILGSGLDVRFELGQRHEDASFDLVRGDLRIELPAVAGRLLSFGIGADRTTFAGELGRVRLRQRFGGSVGFAGRRGNGTDTYGRFRSAVEAARVLDRQRDVDGTGSVEATTSQTLVEFHSMLGRAFTGNVAVEFSVDWRSTETDALPLPRSELWALGGATTVRGYAEERFLGERIAWTRAELVLGPPRAGQGFAFVDVGWVRATTPAGTDESWLQGFGAGLRSPTTLGAIDLSLGFAERIGFDAGKLHLVLVRTF